MIESKQDITWRLGYLAKAYTRARRLVELREEFHHELYEAIVIPGIQYGDERQHNRNPNTDAQAIRIIEMKERYEKKIKKEFRLARTWMTIISEWVTERERYVLIRYFQKEKPMDPEIIQPIIRKIKRKLAVLESKIVEERNKQAMDEFKEFREKNNDLFASESVDIPHEPTKKHHVLLNGRFVYMTDDEFTEHERKEKEHQQEIEIFRNQILEKEEENAQKRKELRERIKRITAYEKKMKKELVK